MDAVRLHVHDKFSVPHGVGHGHAFLQGKASAGSGAAAGKPDGEQDGEDDAETPPASSPSSSKATKGPQPARGEVKVLQLEDSEEGDQTKKPNERRRKTSLVDDRTAEFSNADEYLTAQRSRLSSGVDPANCDT